MRYLMFLVLLACADDELVETDCWGGNEPYQEWKQGQTDACNQDPFAPEYDGLLGYCYEQGYDSVITPEEC